MVKQDEPITGAGLNHLEPITSKTSDVNVEKSEVKDVHATYHEAIAAAPFRPWAKSSVQLYFIFLVAYVNAMASGFDGSIFSSINAMEQYQSYFQLGELGASTGLVMMLYPAGNMIGALLMAPISDLFGRRKAMGAGALLIAAGAIILTAAKNPSYLLGGRFLLGMGVGTGTSAAPTYATEIAPPSIRGRVVGFYNTFFYTGSILSTGVAYAAAKLTGEVAWRMPLGLQLLPPTIILCGIWFIPESPRWLCLKGRYEEAAEVLTKYHGAGDRSHPIVALQIREFAESIKPQSYKDNFNFLQLFNSHNARWRMAMNLMISVCGQLAGNSVLTYYQPAMFRVLGITSTDRRLLLTFANSIVSCFCAICGSATNDMIGRRTKLWIGSIVLSCLFACVTGFSSQFGADMPVNLPVSNAGIASIFLFGGAYSFVYTPLSPTYSAECLDNHTRAKGMALKIVCNNIVNMYNTFVTAVALEAISWKYYILFVALNLVYAGAWYVFGVETGGRTLEELNEVFESKWPPTASRQKSGSTRAESAGMDPELA